MYSRQHRTSKKPNLEPETTNQFAPKPFTVPQLGTGTPEPTPDLQTPSEQTKSTTSNWPDVSFFTYRPPAAPPPRVQMKRSVNKSGEQILHKGRKPPSKVQEIQKAIAAKNAQQVLTILAGASDSEFTLLVQSFTAANTRWFLENLPKANTVANQAEIIQRFKGERSVEAMVGLKGKLYWAGGSGADPKNQYRIKKTTTRPVDKDLNVMETNVNEFALWMREGIKPNNASKMNCWEAILYGAYLAGVVTEKWLVDIHDKATEKAAKTAANQGEKLGEATYQEILGEYLGLKKSQPLTKQNQPKRGDIIFMNGLSHVVISLGGTDSKGNHPVMSLWVLPRDGEQLSNNVQKTTIEAINTDWQNVAKKKKWDSSPLQVTFAPNPF